MTIAPVHLPDWLLAGFVGFGPILVRAGVAILRARRAAGSPLLVVGHSAGGIVARLAMSPVPFDGRRANAAGAVGALVTLGTPHQLHHDPPRLARAGLEAARFLERHTPGAAFAPTTAYLSVGSDFVDPSHREDETSAWDAVRGRIFRGIVGPGDGAGGDGIVPEPVTQLPGAEQLTFHDVRHGHIGGPWYADDEIVGRWWPRAVELWEGALRARAERGRGPAVAGTREAG